jgi:hypothetical protein
MPTTRPTSAGSVGGKGNESSATSRPDVEVLSVISFREARRRREPYPLGEVNGHGVAQDLTKKRDLRRRHS